MFGRSEAADPAGDCEPSRPSEKDSRVSALSGAAKYKSMSPARLPISRAPCLTIHPGLSPTTLLDSPVLLTNVKVEPSPTTGTFTIPSIVSSIGHDLSVSPTGSPNNSSSEEGCSDDFEFKPRSMVSLSTDQPLRNLPPIEIEQQQFAVKACNQYSSEISTTSCIKPESEYAKLNGLTSSLVSTLPERGNSVSVASSEVSSNKMQCLNQSIDVIRASQMDNKGPDVLNSTEKTMEDGYNWRKYGQKHVKGSEFPRSYYKCTHPNCQVKKQLERSHDGQVTDIIYKGKHDHPKPQPSRKLGIGAALCGQEEERIDALSSSVSGEDRGLKVGDQKCSLNDSNRISELSPISEANDNVGPAEISSNKFDEIADEDDDPEAKRRRKDNCSMDVTAMNKITREPRVVIQTLSEVDILDDGYRWRKYGQKVVKGNPNPRSYYKCTNVGCPVRKHVERASHDPKAVITTYEGKHNHDVPAARTSSHDTAASMTINSGGTIYGCITVPMAYEGVLPSSHNFNQCDESDSISLDLGVGLTPRQKDGNNHQPQIPASERGHSMEIDSSSSGCSNLVIPPVVSASYYGVSNSGTSYTGESFSFAPATVGHPSDPYKVNMGNLLMGP